MTAVEQIRPGVEAEPPQHLRLALVLYRLEGSWIVAGTAHTGATYYETFPRFEGMVAFLRAREQAARHETN